MRERERERAESTGVRPATRITSSRVERLHIDRCAQSSHSEVTWRLPAVNSDPTSAAANSVRSV